MKNLKKMILIIVLGLIAGIFGPQVRADGDTAALEAAQTSVLAAVANEETYTLASFAAFEQILTDQGGLVAIEAMIAAPTSQPDVDAMTAALQEALGKLVTASSLQVLTYRNNLAISTYYEDRSSYTISSHDAFKAAVDAYGGYLTVNQLIANPNVTQAEVTAMSAALLAAFTLLETQGDVTLLQSAYETAAAYDLTPYIPASVTAFSGERSRIHDILIGADSTQTEIDQAVFDLVAAYELLVLFADKTALTTAVAQAQGIKSEKYTVSSYYVLASLLVEAAILQTDPDALQAEVDQMALDIGNTIDALRALPEEVELTVGVSDFDISTLITLGGSTIVGYSSSDPSIATVDANGNVSPVLFGSTVITVTLANGVIETIPVFVKEKVQLLTILLLSGIPVISVGTAALLISVKTRPVEIIQRVKKNLKKVKKAKKQITLPSDALTKSEKAL